MLGGGFPEVLADKLERNTQMIRSLRRRVEEGMPVYAECGGLMYLTRSIRGYRGSAKKQKMLGIIDADVHMTGRLTLNYTEAACYGPLLGKTRIRGHEFHYSEMRDIDPDTRYAYRLSRGKGIDGHRDGVIINGNGLAAYTHLHFVGNGLAEKIVNACLSFSRR
jgi:cobyrinic acid a,c-diamide synthase